MFKNLTQIYCVIVCLIASIVMMITIGIMLNSGTDFVFTEYKYMSELNKFSSDEKYIDHKKQISSSDKEEQKTLKTVLIKEKRIADREDYIKVAKGNDLSSIISCISWLVTGLFFFIIHWKMYRCSGLTKV